MHKFSQSRTTQPLVGTVLRREAGEAVRQRLFARVLALLYFILVLVMIYGVLLP